MGDMGPKTDAADSVGAARSEDASVVAALDAARSGCGETLGKLTEQCRAYLLHVAMGELSDDLRAKVGASDLVQDTLLQAKTNFPRFTGTTEPELKAWLRGVLLHNVQESSRRFLQTKMREVRREVSLNDSSNAAAAHLIDVGMPTPGTQVERDEDAARLNAALARLPDEYRRVIVLREFEDRSYPEIAEILGKTADSTRKLWLRAIVRLKDDLFGKNGDVGELRDC